MNWKTSRKWLVAMAAVTTLGISAGTVASAQGPGQGPDNGQGRGPRAGIVFGSVCSTTDVAEVAAKAIGITSAELRVALVSGKTLSKIAESKNVTLQTVQDALAAARKADLDQALKDGLITQEEYDALTQAQANAPTTRGFGLRIPALHTVNVEVEAAKALNMTCADLVKTLREGKSIAGVATDKGVVVQTVIDAIVNAHKSALAKDVEEGLITQAQSDARAARLVEEVGRMVYSTFMQRPQRPDMAPMGPGGRSGRPGQPIRPNQPGQPPAPPATPDPSGAGQ